MIGIRLEAEVHIITGSKTSAQNLIRCINRAGFRVNDIVLNSLAASGAVLSEDEKELGVMLVDLGGGTTDVLVHLDGSPYHTNVISIGGTQVTSDLSILLKTPLEAAEKIKIDAGCCYLPHVDSEEEVVIPGVGGWPTASIPRKEMCRIIQSRMSETFSMVKEQVEKKGYLKHLGGGVVLTGGGALMPGAADLARAVFGIPARIGFPKEVGGLVAEYKNPAYAAAVGLVMYAAEISDIESFDRHTKRKKPTVLLGRLRDVFGEFF
jgi:cell division protein FtsA